MNGEDFARIAGEALAPFLAELGFAMEEPSISGRHYRVRFLGSDHAVSVSYEPGDEALFVMVFGYKDGEVSDIDDREATLRLADLNRRFMHEVSEEEFVANDAYFESVPIGDEEERRVLKAARELRLVLPRLFSSESSD